MSKRENAGGVQPPMLPRSRKQGAPSCFQVRTPDDLCPCTFGASPSAWWSSRWGSEASPSRRSPSIASGSFTNRAGAPSASTWPPSPSPSSNGQPGETSSFSVARPLNESRSRASLGRNRCSIAIGSDGSRLESLADSLLACLPKPNGNSHAAVDRQRSTSTVTERRHFESRDGSRGRHRRAGGLLAASDRTRSAYTTCMGAFESGATMCTTRTRTVIVPHEP